MAEWLSGWVCEDEDEGEREGKVESGEGRGEQGGRVKGGGQKQKIRRKKRR